MQSFHLFKALKIYVLMELKMNFDKKEYEKRKVIPTKLTFEEKYPSSTGYKTPNSIKFLKEFDFKKKKF